MAKKSGKKKPSIKKTEPPTNKKVDKSSNRKEKHKEKEENKKPKSNSKKMKLIIIIPFIVIIALLIFILFAPKPAEASDESNAQLLIEYGTVQVKHGDGIWTEAENGLLLYQSDSIRTSDNTSASIVLFKGSIIRLDSNTEITLLEILAEEETKVTINQDSGRTWNTVRKISGIDNYEVQTPTTVASVRGTSFTVLVSNITGETSYGVINGSLNVSSKKNDTIIDTINLKENESVNVDPKDIFKPLEKEPLEEDEWIDENIEKDEQMILDEKEELYKKIGEYIPQMMDRYNITEWEIDALIEGYLRGYYKDYPIPENIPDWIMELIALP